MKRYSFNRFFDLLNDDFGFPSFWDVPVFTAHYSLYDPKTHDLVPKESYKKELISQKEKEIEDLDKQKKVLQESLHKLKENT